MAAEITMKGTPWVEFGPGACGQLSFLADTFGCERTFAVVDAGAADAVEPLLREGLGERLVAVSRYEAGEPTVELADSFAAEARQAGARSVVGAGGGSAMDVAKSVAVLLTNPGSAADYQGFGLVREQGSPLVLIPTTAGSGSEATWSAVLINEATGIKRGINGPQVFARA